MKKGSCGPCKTVRETCACNGLRCIPMWAETLLHKPWPLYFTNPIAAGIDPLHPSLDNARGIVFSKEQHLSLEKYGRTCLFLGPYDDPTTLTVQKCLYLFICLNYKFGMEMQRMNKFVNFTGWYLFFLVQHVEWLTLSLLEIYINYLMFVLAKKKSIMIH